MINEINAVAIVAGHKVKSSATRSAKSAESSALKIMHYIMWNDRLGNGRISEVSRPASRREAIAKWKGIVAEYQKSNAWKASWQLLNSLGGYVLLWGLMYYCMSISWWLVIPLAFVAGAMLIRVFIIFHDCGHGSFFDSMKANDFWGFITGLLTFTPYRHWRWQHAVHHASAGHLEKRGTGDIWTLTVEEYLESSRWKKFSYRLARNPIVLFVIAPVFIFLIRQRYPDDLAKPREKASVWIMNLALVAYIGVMVSIFGFLPWLIIQLIVVTVTGSAGIWLFYVQHQFEDAYWANDDEWDYTAAAMQGSSFYKLPRVLQWFSGNIGFHHIHHLSSTIPNYNLERCHHSDPMFQGVRPMMLLESFRAMSLRLWDEQSEKLITFTHLKKQQREREIGVRKNFDKV